MHENNSSFNISFERGTNRELCCFYLSVGFILSYFNIKSLWSLKNRTSKFMKQKLVDLKGEIENPQ